MELDWSSLEAPTSVPSRHGGKSKDADAREGGNRGHLHLSRGSEGQGSGVQVWNLILDLNLKLV